MSDLRILAVRITERETLVDDSYDGSSLEISTPYILTLNFCVRLCGVKSVFKSLNEDICLIFNLNEISHIEKLQLQAGI